jgi:putative hemolysin
MKLKNTLLITMGLLLVVSLLATGCTQPAAAPATTTTVVTTIAPATAGLANPASVNCGRIGGTTEIKTNTDGSQYGMCNFPNGTTCEEWALFRNEGCNNGTAVTTTAPVGVGMANPASVNCGKIGGTVEIKKDAQGNEYGMCTFTNGSSCDEWALFRNEGCKPFTAVTATPSAGIGMANPASVNCGKAGATSEIMNNPDGSQYGMCKFPNGTTCEEWALFRGEGCKPNVAPNATPVK